MLFGATLRRSLFAQALGPALFAARSLFARLLVTRSLFASVETRSLFASRLDAGAFFTRRFDARFFMAPAEALLHPEPTAGSGELDEIGWLDLGEARAQDLPAITRFVLGEVGERLATPDRPLPFVRMVRGKHVVERLD